MKLRIGITFYDVVQSCSDMVILSEEHSVPSDSAEVIITVDGKEDRHPVILYGESSPTRKVRFW